MHEGLMSGRRQAIDMGAIATAPLRIERAYLPILNAVNASESCEPLTLYHRDGRYSDGFGKYRGLYSRQRTHSGSDVSKRVYVLTDADHVNRDLRPFGHDNNLLSLDTRRVGYVENSVFDSFTNHECAGWEQPEGLVKCSCDSV